MAAWIPTEKHIVLIVEDEVLVRLNAEDVIKGAGFRVLSTADADEAICLLESRDDIRAIFTDIQMPGSLDGLALARIVRNRWPPVGVLVTSGREDCSAKDLPKGARFLRKPYLPAQVGSVLRELIC